MLINSTQLKNNPVMNKNKTTVMANNLNTSSNINSSNNGVQKHKLVPLLARLGWNPSWGRN